MIERNNINAMQETVQKLNEGITSWPPDMRNVTEANDQIATLLKIYDVSSGMFAKYNVDDVPFPETSFEETPTEQGLSLEEQIVQGCERAMKQAARNGQEAINNYKPEEAEKAANQLLAVDAIRTASINIFSSSSTSELRQALTLEPEELWIQLEHSKKYNETELSYFKQQTFGSVLNYFRKKNGMQQNELGEKSRVTPNYISHLITGKRTSPSDIVVQQIGEALGWTPKDVEMSLLFMKAQELRDSQSKDSTKGEISAKTEVKENISRATLEEIRNQLKQSRQDNSENIGNLQFKYFDVVLTFLIKQEEQIRQTSESTYKNPIRPISWEKYGLFDPAKAVKTMEESNFGYVNSYTEHRYEVLTALVKNYAEHPLKGVNLFETANSLGMSHQSITNMYHAFEDIFSFLPPHSQDSLLQEAVLSEVLALSEELSEEDVSSRSKKISIISQLLGISESTVNSILPRLYKRGETVTDLKGPCLKMYNEGKSYKAISEALSTEARKVTPRTVSYIIDRHKNNTENFKLRRPRKKDNENISE